MQPDTVQSETSREAWASLDAELDAWRAAGREATFWWRDDDATGPGAKLARLVEISRRHGAPLSLAVIPVGLEPALIAALDDGVSLLQHGYAHINHAPRGQGLGAWELGLHRGREAVLADLAKGLALVSDIAGDAFIPVIAAPWNHIDPALFPDLPSLGFRGVSAFGARDRAALPAGLTLNNAHCDPIKWKRDAGFAGETKAISQLTGHLLARRTGTADPDEATGLLTHHLVMDEETWSFTARLIERIASHRATRLLGAAELFAP